MPRIDCFDIIKNNPELVAEFVSITEDMPELEQRKQAIQIVNKLLEASNESLNKVKRKVGQKPQKYNSGVSQDAIDEIIKKYSQPEQKETPQEGSVVSGEVMPKEISDLYSEAASLRFTLNALKQQMGGKTLVGKAKTEYENTKTRLDNIELKLSEYEQSKSQDKPKAEELKKEKAVETKQIFEAGEEANYYDDLFDKTDKVKILYKTGDGENGTERYQVQFENGQEASIWSDKLQPLKATPQAGSVVGGDVKDYKGVFNPKKTGISGLDVLLKDDGYNYFYKGVSGEVVMMSPDEYLKRVREGLKTKEDANVTEDKKDAINKAINEGNKINMPFISEKDGKFSQEGRNRAVVARERGEKLIPVFIEKDVSFDDKIAKGQEYINSAIKDGATTKDEVLSKLKEQGLHRDAIRFIDNNFDNKAVEQSLQATSQAEFDNSEQGDVKFLAGGKSNLSEADEVQEVSEIIEKAAKEGNLISVDINEDVPKTNIPIVRSEKRPEGKLMNALRIGLDFIKDSRIGIGMSDWLRTGDREVTELGVDGKPQKKTIRDEGGIGYPFKSLMDLINGVQTDVNKIFGWAGVDEGAGTRMINAAKSAKKITGKELKSHYYKSLPNLTPKEKARIEKAIPNNKEYGVVGIFKMGASGLHSNEAFSSEALRQIETKLNETEKEIFFIAVEERLNSLEWKGKDKYLEMFNKANNFAELDAILKDPKLSLDVKSSIMNKIILSTSETESKEGTLAKLLKDYDITLESITDVTKEPQMDNMGENELTILVAIDPTQGEPFNDKKRVRHNNYPYAVRGFPIGVLTEGMSLINLSPNLMGKYIKQSTLVVDDNASRTVDGKVEQKRIGLYQGADGLWYAEEGKGTTKKDVIEDGSTQSKYGENKSPLIFGNTKEDLIAKLEGKGYEISESAKTEAYAPQAPFLGGQTMTTLAATEIFSKPQFTPQEKLVKFLQKAFPNIVVEMTQKGFDAVQNNLIERKLLTKNGKAYGFIKDGKIYLDPSKLNNNTPIHEFGHIWSAVAKVSTPKVYQKGLSLVAGTKYEQSVLQSPEYQKIIKNLFGSDAIKKIGGKFIINENLPSEKLAELKEYIGDEALNKAIGDRGELFVNEAQRTNFKNWLDLLYTAIKNIMGISRRKASEIQKMNLNQFLDAVIADLLGGQKLSNVSSEKLSKEGDKMRFSAKETGNYGKGSRDLQEDRVDRSGNIVGDGSWHKEHIVFDMDEYPSVNTSVSKSDTTESVYVTYTNEDNGKSAVVRFSTHENNAVKFGDQLDGDFATKNEVLYRLGLANRKFVPNKRLRIPTTQVKKSDLDKYDEADKTIKELYDLGANADISQYNGKLAKGSNYLILGDKVTEETDKRLNAFGEAVERGTYIYEPIQKTDLQEAERKLKEAWGKYLSNGISFDGMAEAEKERQLIVALLGYLKAKGIDIAKGIGNEVREFIKNKFGGVTDEMIDVAQGRMLTDYQKLYDTHMTPKNKEILDDMVSQVKSGEMSFEDFVNTIDNIVPNERIKNVFISYVNEQIDPLDGYVAVDEEIEELPESPKAETSKEEERAFIGGLLARPINNKNFPNIVGGNKTDDDVLKRITAVTQEDVQDRKVMVDTSYVRVALENIKEIALQNANALYMQFGEDWQTKVMDYLSDYLNAANPAQAIGILNVISTDVQQKIEKSQSPTERTKLFKLQDKADELSILFASQASLGINARKILRQFAQGGNMSKLVLDKILTEDTMETIEEINRIAASKPTNEELNNATLPVQTPQTPKSRIQKIKANVKAALSSKQKKKPKITEQEIKELGQRAEEERKRQGIQTKMSRQQIAQMLKDEAKKC